MTRKLNILIIIGLICFLVFSHYLWEKKYETLNAKITAIVASNQKESADMLKRLSEFCAKLSKIERTYNAKFTSEEQFTIVGDDGG